MFIKNIFVLLAISLSIYQANAQNGNPRYQYNDMPVEKPTMGYLPINVTSPDIPKSFSLFGEKMPLELWDVRERFDRELLVNTYMQGSTSYIIKLMNRWIPMIEERLAANGIPDDFKYLCIAESALQNQTSKAGAVGFWQFMSGTAPSYGLLIDGEIDERYNAEKSTDAACKYLRDAYNKFGSWTSAAASYNCGMGGMNSALTSQGETSFYNVLLPEETMRYIFRIAALKYILSNQKMMGFNLQGDDVYQPLKVRRETISGGIGSLVSYAKSKGTNYKTIKMLNPWMRDKFLNNSKGRTYTILLPL
ncbi:MAG TPA: lytic transglycosylase domain-containing protein [Chitinophagaceae bacterium]|nr:lytic transglycosylase domain-containing protein [Chitinophagaceae bacterium]